MTDPADSSPRPSASDASSASSAAPASPPDGLVTLRSKMSPIYAPIFGDLFDRPQVVEKRATCDTCAMCDHGQLAPVAMDYFRPSSKCCTFYPGLANYLVGAILADTGEELAEGRRRIRAKIAERTGVSPCVLAAPRKYNVLYAAARGAGFFGRSEVMMCPYFDGTKDASCTVWRYREAVCSTYFCKHTDGKPGFEFWDALKGYLSHVERTLAIAAAHAVDATVSEPPNDRFTLTAEDIEGLPPKEADYATWWGNGKWVGREEEFYVACYEKVRGLSKAEFAKNVDDSPNGRGAVAKLEAKYDAIANRKLPPVLIRATNLTKRDAGESVVVTTYNPFDAFSLEKELFDVLGLFKAEETLEQNLARLDTEHDVQLAPELVQYLYTHGVLSAPEADKPRTGHALAATPVTPVKPATPAAVAVSPILAPAPQSRSERRAAAAKGNKKKR